MGSAILRDVLENWSQYDLGDEIYVPSEDLTLNSEVVVLAFDIDRGRDFEGRRYLLGMEQVRDVIEGLEAQLGRRATPDERLRAILYFAEYDAFIDPAVVVQ
jgi:hypothetical protein